MEGRARVTIQSRAAERRVRVMGAVVAISEAAIMQDGGGVLAFHVAYFGIPECVRDVSETTIERDLRWLRDQGYVEHANERRGQRAEYVPTDAGREWLRDTQMSQQGEG